MAPTLANLGFLEGRGVAVVSLLETDARYCSSANIVPRKMTEVKIPDDPTVRNGDLCVR